MMLVYFRDKHTYSFCTIKYYRLGECAERQVRFHTVVLTPHSDSCSKYSESVTYNIQVRLNKDPERPWPLTCQNYIAVCL